MSAGWSGPITILWSVSLRNVGATRHLFSLGTKLSSHVFGLILKFKQTIHCCQNCRPIKFKSLPLRVIRVLTIMVEFAILGQLTHCNVIFKDKYPYCCFYHNISSNMFFFLSVYLTVTQCVT